MRVCWWEYFCRSGVAMVDASKDISLEHFFLSYHFAFRWKRIIVCTDVLVDVWIYVMRLGETKAKKVQKYV